MGYVRLSYPKFQAFTDDGLLAVGYEVHTFEAGTSTPLATYSDRGLTTPNTNPVVLNARGEADIYVGQQTKLCFTEPSGDPDSPIWTVDYVGEQQSNILTGAATPTTSHNQYIVDVTPAPAALTDNLTVIFTPDVTNTATEGTTTYSGTGPNDCVFGGQYTGSTSGSIFYVEIDAEGTPDTFKWKKDAGSYTTGVAITGGTQQLIEGITVDFAILSGHTLADLWTLEVDTAATLNLNSLGAKLIYKNIGTNLELLGAGDLQEDMPAQVIYSATQDCWLLINPSDPVYSSIVPNRLRIDTADDYSLEVDDHGDEINFTAATAKILTLPPAAEFANKFVYVRASGAGSVTITADGSEKIYGRKNYAGGTTYLLIGNQGETVQISTNGVDWQVLTETILPKNVIIFTGSGTYTKSFGAQFIESHVYGAGGGGAAAYGTVPGTGGSGGGYSYKFIAAANVGATETVTVGAGGAGGATSGAAGVAGGTSSFGSHNSATGGAGGAANAAPISTGIGAGTGGSINLYGGDGFPWFYANVGGFGGVGAGPIGGTVTTGRLGNAGLDGHAFGGGGSGGSHDGAADRAGGNGSHGVVIIMEYF